MIRDRRAQRCKISSMLRYGDHSRTVMSRCDKGSKNSIAIKRGYKAKVNIGGEMSRSGGDFRCMTCHDRQLNREESNAISIIAGCGTSGICLAVYWVMIQVGAIVNMRIRPIYIRKHNMRNNTIS